MTASASQHIADLRHRRRDLRGELARVRWWRRLLAARRDLVVGALARPTEAGAPGLDVAWEALAADAPTGTELAIALWPEATGLRTQDLDRLDALDARLASFESRVSAALDTVTAQMVHAMAASHGHPRTPSED